MAEKLPELEENKGAEVKNQVAICSGTSTDEYTLRELREIESARSFSESKETNMANLIKEVNEMGWFMRFMETKVPNKKKRFWRFFSLKVADPVVLGEEIEKHQKLYKEIKEALLKARNRDENAGEVLEDMYEKLMKVYTVDELKIDNDDSKTLCNLHQNFVAEKDKLENSIRRVENAHSRMEQRRTQKKLDLTMNKVDDLMREVRQSEMQSANLLDKAETLMDMNKQLLGRQIKVEQELENGRSSYKNLEEKFDKVLALNENLVKREIEKERERVEEKERERKKDEELEKERQKDRDQIDLMMTLLKEFFDKPPGDDKK